MGCNCGGTSQANAVWVYTDKNGNTTTYTSEVQARAAQIRQGGGTYRATAAR